MSNIVDFEMNRKEQEVKKKMHKRLGTAERILLQEIQAVFELQGATQLLDLCPMEPK